MPGPLYEMARSSIKRRVKMPVELDITLKICIPILTLIIGIFINRIAEAKPRLITYYSHVSAINIHPNKIEPFQVNSHAIYIRNTGRKAAKNVRIGHQFLPDYQIFPPIDHSVKDLQGGGKEIVIPTLVAKEQIIINYLYYSPVTYDSVNTSIKSDDGYAKHVKVLLTRQYPKSLSIISAILTLLGFSTLFYFIVLLTIWLITLTK